MATKFEYPCSVLYSVTTKADLFKLVTRVFESCQYLQTHSNVFDVAFYLLPKTNTKKNKNEQTKQMSYIIVAMWPISPRSAVKPTKPNNFFSQTSPDEDIRLTRQRIHEQEQGIIERENAGPMQQ